MGSALRSQPVENKSRIARSLKEQVWPLIEEGKIKPVIHKVFPLMDAAEAHRLMESSKHIGKIVLKV
jgi:NADPH2:quinone reductase